MDALRLILLILGLAVIGFIYLRARRQQGKGLDILRHFDKTFISSFKIKTPSSEPVHPRREDKLLDEDDLAAIDGLVAARETQPDTQPSADMEMTTTELSPEAGEPLIITLSLMAKQGKLQGPDLSAALHGQGFQFGDMMAFHLYVEGHKGGRPVCTAVNVLEPGSFPDASLEGIEVPGIILLMQLPGPLEPRVAFEHLLRAGQQLAASLNADLCDEQRNILTQQGIAHLKDTVEAYRFKQKMAQIKRRS